MVEYIHNMNFADGFVKYFTDILDVTNYIMFFFFSIALVIFSLPKAFKKKDIYLGLIRLVIIYVLYVFGESLFFSLAFMMGMPWGGIFFTISFAFLPILYIGVFSKGYHLHKVIRIFVMVSSFMIISEISKTLGFIVQGDTEPNANIVAVTIVRCLPFIFMPLIAFIHFKFDINRFKRLPIVHVVITITLSSLLIVSSVWQNVANVSDNSIRWLLIFISFVELFVLVGIYYAIYYLIDTRHRLTELEVQSTVLSLEKESLEIDARNREELMKIRHDLQNQLSYMSVLLNDGKYDEAKNYIQSLTDQKEEYLYSFSCSNLVISGIVNLELTKAKIANKKIKFKVVVPPKLPFEDSDLLSLITNIVDNSIENFKPVDNKDVINVSIVTQQDYLRITAFNSVDPELVKEKPSLRTTKKNRGHGYGTKIIKNITKKYEGYVTFTYEDNKFVSDCLINMNHKGANNA